MSTLNSLMETGKRGVLTHQEVLTVIGHNIANVNTEGYSRQRANLGTTLPANDVNYGQIGTGVQVDSITRARDALMDEQVRTENSTLGHWERANTALGQLEGIFLEPDDYGFNDVLNDFWDAWSDLANNPDSSSARTVLRERTIHMTDTFNNFDADIKLVEQQLDEEFVNLVDELNNIGGGIADLNIKIRLAESVGQNANDLRDERDRLLDTMSKLIQTKYSENEDGTMNVYINGDIFVQENQYRALDTRNIIRNDVTVSELIWDDNNSEVVLNSGTLAGIVKVRDDDCEFMRNRLDELANAIIENVNGLHHEGYGLNGSHGTYFFDQYSSGAANIRLSDTILSDANTIAAAGTNAPGDNTAALDIAALSNKLIMNGGTETFADHYANTVADLGARKQTAEMYYSQADAVDTQLSNLRQSFQGVVMDEELTELIRFQQAYNASARVITVANEMMDVVIRLGA